MPNSDSEDRDPHSTLRAATQEKEYGTTQGGLQTTTAAKPPIHSAAFQKAADSKELPMLVLSRRTNETLVIDNNIRFTVLSVHGNQVRIGIEAPDDVIILREEIIHSGSRANSGGNAVQGNASQGNTADYHAADAQGQHRQHSRTPYEARSPRAEVRQSSDAYRRHDSGPDYGRGNEQGKRRGVLGLRRRRP
jgi:carbon storage regulator